MQLDAALPIVRALADGVNPITGKRGQSGNHAVSLYAP